MIVLPTTSDSIVIKLAGAITTSQPEFTTAYQDHTSSAVSEGASDGATNSTTEVTLVDAPSASTSRLVKTITVHNKDTVAAVVIIEKANGATRRRICRISLPTNSTMVIDSNGITVDTTTVVQSVGLTLPTALFVNDGTPVTQTGSVSASLATQSSNTVLAGPTSGGASPPTFRALAIADMPASYTSAYDKLSQRVSSEITVSIGSSTTLPSTMWGILHNVVGTSSLMTVTLPHPSTGSGKMVGFVNSGTASLVLDAGSGVTINNLRYRKYWGGTGTAPREAVVLMSDGTNYRVVDEVKAGLAVLAQHSAAQTINAATITPLILGNQGNTTNDRDSLLSVGTNGAGLFTAPVSDFYKFDYAIGWGASGAGSTLADHAIYYQQNYGGFLAASSVWFAPSPSGLGYVQAGALFLSLSQGDTVQFGGYHTFSSAKQIISSRVSMQRAGINGANS